MKMWADNDPRQIFVDGASWYMFIMCGDANPIDADLAPFIKEAEERFPGGEVPKRDE